MPYKYCDTLPSGVRTMIALTCAHCFVVSSHL